MQVHTYIACRCLLFVCLLLPIVGNGKEEKSIAIQISVCRAFRGGHFAGTGSSVVVFKLIVLTPVCQFHLSAASLCCLGESIKVVIFVGENSALYSYQPRARLSSILWHFTYQPRASVLWGLPSVWSVWRLSVGLSLLSSHLIARTTRESTWYALSSVGALRAMLHLLDSRERNFSL